MKSLLFVLSLVALCCASSTLKQSNYVPYDSESGALITEDWGHFNRHAGKSFEINDTVTLDDGDSAIFYVRNTTEDTEMHILFQINTSTATTASFFRDVPTDSIDNAPDTLDAFNADFGAANTTNGALFIFNKALIKDYGTHCFASHWGTAGSPSGVGKFGGGARNQNEYIFPYSATLGYLIVIRSQADGNKVNIGCEYYLTND